jgi:hypothetical protein
MINRIIDFSAQHKLLVLACWLWRALRLVVHASVALDAMRT